MDNFWYFFNFVWPGLALVAFIFAIGGTIALTFKLVRALRLFIASLKDALSRGPRLKWPAL